MLFGKPVRAGECWSFDMAGSIRHVKGLPHGYGWLNASTAYAVAASDMNCPT
jgi:hypothetical protein